MKVRSLLVLVGFIALPLVLGAIAGHVTSQNITSWYGQLNKPWFSPPNSLFAPVWTTLYVLMGISAFLVWRQPVSECRRAALALYFAQLALNFLWSFIFFYFKLPGAALFELLLLLATVLFWIYTMHGVYRLAAWLQIPYVLWLSFATVLNAAIVWLNH